MKSNYYSTLKTDYNTAGIDGQQKIVIGFLWQVLKKKINEVRDSD